MKKSLLNLCICVALVFGISKTAWATITITEPTAGQQVEIKTNGLHLSFNYTTYIPSARGEFYKDGVLVGTNFQVYSSISINTNTLTPGNYQIKVYNQYNTAEYAWSPTFQVIAYPAPTNLTVTSPSNTQLTLNWSAVTGATSYRYDVSPNGSFSPYTYSDVIASTNSNVTVSGLTPGKVYYVKVRAVGPNGTSPDSGISGTNTLLYAPTATAASSITGNSFVANWSASSGAAGYRIDVSTNTSFSSFVSGYQNLTVSSGTSVSVTGLLSNTAYYYRVRAFTSDISSVSSSTITVGTTLPAPVANAITSITATGFTVSWAAVTNASAYRYDVSRNSGFTDLALSNISVLNSTTSVSISSLQSSTTYWFRVRAEGNYTPSPFSNTPTAKTLAAPPTANNATSIGATSFVVNWTTVAAAVSYRLDVCTDASYTVFLPGFNDKVVNTTSQMVEVPTSNANYYWRVRSYDGTGTSVNSNTMRMGLAAVSHPYQGQHVSQGSNFQIYFRAPSYMVSGKAEVYKDDNPTPITSFTSVYDGSYATVSSSSLPVGTGYRVRMFDQTAQQTEGWSGPFDVVPNTFNYIQITTANKETSTVMNARALPIGDKDETYQFFDGLGRLMQSVDERKSPARLDIVQPVVYDNYGRQSVNYLPYTSGTSAWYKDNFRPKESTDYENATINKQYDFHRNTTKIEDEPKPYQETTFEKSPLNRPFKTGMTGTAYQPNTSPYSAPTDHTIAYSYETNIAGEVLKWTYEPTNNNTLGLVNASSGATPIYYPPYKLSKTLTKDQNHNEVVEYKNNEGLVLFRKVQVGSEWAQTYYIYNAQNNLACVLPPEAVKAIIKTPTSEYFNQNNSVKEAFLKRWAFRYQYDGRKRMAKKQVPGSGAVFMVYDNRDRLILTQDSIQRASTPKYWGFTKYDVFNRPVVTGIHDTTALIAQSDMQSGVNTYFAKPGPSRWSETLTGALHGYTNRAFPVVKDPMNCLTVTYYDDYSYKTSQFLDGRYNYKNDEISGEQPTTADQQLKGIITGSKIKVLDGGVINGVTGGFTWLTTVNYYDSKARLVQTVSDNYKGGQDFITTVYDFTGKALKTRNTHFNKNVIWKDKVGVNLTGNILRSLGPTGWASGAASQQVLAAGQPGWIEVIASEQSYQKIVGLASSNPDANFTSINYAIKMQNNQLSIWESGTAKGGINVAIKPGDVLRIERIGSTIYYTKNGAPVYTSLVSSTTQLIADASFYELNGSIVGVRTSFGNTSQTILRKFQYDHGGRLVQVIHKLNSDPEVLLTKNEYNELGQLVDKKLHSTAGASGPFKQSVDYRYNSRGWLTKINQADLGGDDVGDPSDFYGLQLSYEDDPKTNSVAYQYPQYNGNISAMKWSANLGQGAVKQRAYEYRYDQLNRISQANYKEAQAPAILANWSGVANSGLAETGYEYDLSGNITKLKRNDRRTSGWMDDLTYSYVNGTASSNRLMKVTDAGDDYAGFVEGVNGSADDYAYDANGNMTKDLNKGILLINYNFMNLPERILKGNNYVKYQFTATGTKLGQVVDFGNDQKQTDYNGEFEYENNVLTSINHEEGRVVMFEQEMMFRSDGDDIADVTATSVTASLITQNTKTYVKAVANGTASGGLSDLGGAFAVQAGQRYRVRVKAYRDKGTAASSNNAYLYVKADGNNIDGGALIPSGVDAESWIEKTIAIPAGATAMLVGVNWGTVLSGEALYLNEFDITKLGATTPEYQYSLKDHLGNSRVTFTTKPDVDAYSATFENNTQTTEQKTFSNYSRINFDLFDHTDVGGTTYTYSQLLNGAANSQIGVAKSFSVMPGDVIKAEVDVKYEGTTGGTSNITAFATALLSAFGLPTPIVGEAGTAASAINNYGSLIAGGNNPNDHTPKGWLNVLVFDKNYNLIDLAIEQLDAQYVQSLSGTKSAFDHLMREVLIKEPGYVYIYVSNEGSVQQNIYFDDMLITYTKSPIIQMQDYYPFGLTFNEYQGENSVRNQFQFNGKKQQDELNVGWLDFGARMYEPSIGRFMVQDAFSDKFLGFTPYQYAANNPVKYIDFNGDSIILSEAFLKNKVLMAAFKTFAGTKEGKAFLSQYAAKGQEVMGIKFDKDGALNGKGIDISYNTKDLGESTRGQTDSNEKANGRIDIGITLNSRDNLKEDNGKSLTGNDLLFDKTKTLFHESFIHGDMDTKDYLDNGRFDNSNISKAAKADAGGFSFVEHYQHSAARLDFVNKGYNTLWPGSAYRGLKTVNDRLKTGYSDQQIVDKMWNFSGAR